MVMPPVRSQSLAAAGRQGAKSFMSMALAVVTENPKSKSPNSDVVMSLTDPLLLVDRDVLAAGGD